MAHIMNFGTAAPEYALEGIGAFVRSVRGSLMLDAHRGRRRGGRGGVTLRTA